MYKSPGKRKLIDNLWKQDKEIGKYMYFLGKYKNKKNQTKLLQTVNNIKKQYTSLRGACRETSFKWSQFQKHTTLNKRKIENRKFIRKLNPHEIDSIGNFYESGDTSFPLPDKKHAGKRFLRKSLSKSCKMYNMLATTTRKISQSTFRKYKPKHVKLQGKIPFRQSCCEVCQNFEFIMNNASKYLQGVPNMIVVLTLVCVNMKHFFQTYLVHCENVQNVEFKI